ncbi:MAG: N-acetyltransferase [Dehalococcoidales bacterium]|nr:N-acetyltransferase [Dehalococcoidales bacterium]
MYKAEKARISDAIQMHKIVNVFADRGEMLPRSLSEIYENIRDFFVCRENDKVLACAALHINWSELAEIKSVAVAEEYQRKDIGSTLIKACLEEAVELGIPTLFCLTYKPGFFKQFGFEEVDKMELPQKVWSECYRCPKFPNCDEIAMILHLTKEK